jgi:hypothetical protein
MESPPLWMWARAFALTCAIEIPIACLILRRPGLPWRFLVALLAQLVTHPAFWYAVPRPEHEGAYWLWVAVCELAIAGVETLVYFYRERTWRAPVASIAANGASFAFGLVAWQLGLFD